MPRKSLRAPNDDLISCLNAACIDLGIETRYGLGKNGWAYATVRGSKVVIRTSQLPSLLDQRRKELEAYEQRMGRF